MHSDVHSAGAMQWHVVPMERKNGNAASLCMMEDHLPLVRDCASPFVDDIIVGSGTEDMTDDKLIQAQQNYLRRALGVLEKHSMVCKLTNATLLVRVVEFARHVVGHRQWRPMSCKLAHLRH